MSRPVETTVAERSAIGVSLALVATAFWSWTVSGTVARSGWATATSALRLGVVDGVPRALTVLWLFVPGLVVLSCLAIVTGRRRAGAVSSVVVGAVALLVGVGVRLGPLPTTSAPLVAAVLGCALVGVGSRMLVTVRAPQRNEA